MPRCRFCAGEHTTAPPGRPSLNTRGRWNLSHARRRTWCFTADKFHGTPLDLALRSRDIRYLMITGIVTDVLLEELAGM